LDDVTIAPSPSAGIGEEADSVRELRSLSERRVIVVHSDSRR
jgi:hypothetical protein